MVGGEGRGRAVGGDGAMAMGCWLRGRSSWEEDGFKAKGEGLSAGGSERRPCVGSEGSEGMCGIRGIRGIRGHHAGSGGAARGPRRWAMRGLSTGGLGAKALRGIRGIRGHVRDQRDHRDQRASRGVGGSGEGHRGGGRCVDLAPRLPFLEVLIDLPCFQS